MTLFTLILRRTFGAITTILGQDVQRNLLAKVLMAAYNRRRIFSNDHDTLTDLKNALKAHFPTYEVNVVGCVAFFAARG